MSEKKYVAYVGSYTHGSSRQGIHVMMLMLRMALLQNAAVLK